MHPPGTQIKPSEANASKARRLDTSTMVSPLGAMDQPASDFDLLAAWRAGNGAAGNTLVGRHYGPLLRFFELRSRTPEDLTQETLLAIVESRDEFRAEASFRAFLFGVARRVLLKGMSKRYRRERLSSFDAPEPRRNTSLSALFARRQEQQFLLMVLTTLPEDTQTLLALAYWENLKAREIAEVMGIPVSTTTTRLARARLRLAEGIRQLATPQTSAALLQDLEGWTRSLAGPESLQQIPAGLAERVASMLTPRP